MITNSQYDKSYFNQGTITVVENQGKKKEERKIQYSFFLFVNPSSGGNKASAYTKLEAERIKFLASNPKEPNSATKFETEVFIYDLQNPEMRKRGFQTLKEEQEKGKSTIRIIVGGGDGTVMWVLEELINNKIEVEKAPIGIVPFGTGNDFSRVLGWGGSAPSNLIGTNLQNLKNMIWKWINAITEEFDIWDMLIETEKEGFFKKITKNEHNKPVKQMVFEEKEKQKPLTIMRKKMSNYCSVGIDARIGLGFDKHRSRNRFKNLIIYCCEGVKKMFLKTLKLNSVIEKMEIIKETDQDMDQEDIQHIDINIEDQTTQKEVLFQTKASNSKQTKAGNQLELNSSDRVLAGNPASLLMININSFMGGASDVWEAAQGKMGLEQSQGKLLKDFNAQNFGDGKLEFLTFDSSLKLGLERFFRGQAKRVAQGTGPFCLKFQSKNDKGNLIKTYFQIDGEYYQVVGAKQIVVNRTTSLPKGKIKVLIENSSRNIKK